MSISKIQFTLCLLFAGLFLQAQVTEVVSGLEGPWDILFDNDTMYISENTGQKISKVDVTANVPTATDLITGLTNGATGIELFGRTMFYGERQGKRVIKFDVSTLARINVTSMNNDNAVSGLHLDGNQLFIAEREGDTLWRVIVDEQIIKEPIATGLQSAYGMARHGDDLYIAELVGNRITKVDLTTLQKTILTSIPGGPIALLIVGDDLYVSEHTAGQISVIDLTNPSAGPSTIATGLEGPFNLAARNNELYISEFNAGRISKIALPTTSVSSVFQNKIQVYPNPSTGEFSVALGQHYDSVIVSLTDMNGRIIQTEEHKNCKQVSLSTSQPVGIYLLQVSAGEEKALLKVVMK